MSFVIRGATILDGVSDRPLKDAAIWIEGERIRAIGRDAEIIVPDGIAVVDARDKFVVPGLLNANVHLFADVRPELLFGYTGRYEELITEAAQLALKNGLTTVFDTWGPRRPLMAVRDAINGGKITGSRIFCAGNIVGFDGPLSPDFMTKAAELASPLAKNRINAIWTENVGRHLMWLTPREVAREVASYLGKGIDFLKFASNEHMGTSTGALLAFTKEVQAAIVGEAHAVGLTAQAHTMSVEGLRIAVEAGSDIIQHANHTGPVPIPGSTVDLMAARGTAAVVFPLTQERLDWLSNNQSYRSPLMWQVADQNVRSFIESDIPLLLGNDGSVLSPDSLADPNFERNFGGSWKDSLFSLTEGHFSWLVAMEQKGCSPMAILKAATSNVARALGRDADLGSLVAGKLADLLVLRADPLVSAKNYREIDLIIKGGAPVDRDALPSEPRLTAPVELCEEEAEYKPFVPGGAALPMCPLCMMSSR